MKIYCSRRYESDDAIFKSLIGKDAWVLVKCRNSWDKTFMGIEYDYMWVKLLEDDDEYYICDGYLVDENDYTKHFQGYSRFGLSKDRTTIIKPVEITTTEELKQSFIDR